MKPLAHTISPNSYWNRICNRSSCVFFPVSLHSTSFLSLVLNFRLHAPWGKEILQVLCKVPCKLTALYKLILMILSVIQSPCISRRFFCLLMTVGFLQSAPLSLKPSPPIPCNLCATVPCCSWGSLYHQGVLYRCLWASWKEGGENLVLQAKFWLPDTLITTHK